MWFLFIFRLVCKARTDLPGTLLRREAVFQSCKDTIKKQVIKKLTLFLKIFTVFSAGAESTGADCAAPPGDNSMMYSNLSKPRR